MKFIHCADLHLDSRIDTLPSEKTKIRREEIVRSFERMVDFAVKEKVTAIIMSGDIFDTSRVTLKTKARVLNAISRAETVDFLYLSGNHDEDSFINSVNEFPKNLKFFSDKWLRFRYGEVVVAGVKLTTLNSSTVYDGLSLNENDINIVALHGQIVGYNRAEKAEIIAIPRLKNKNIDYLALGHIHSFSEGVIDERGKYAYSGCLDGRGFDETGVKGFVLLTAENGKITSEFIAFSSRILHEISFEVNRYNDYFELREALKNKLNQECDLSDLIKVVLKGEHKPDLEIDVDGLTAFLNEDFFFVKIYDKTELKVDISDYEKDKSVRGEFVRAVLESELDAETKQKILTCGLDALKGEI